MPSTKKLLQAAAGNAGESLYVEDVFSTYLYDGNGSTQTITNGIDLDGEGGLVWIKARTVVPAYPTSFPHNLFSQDSGFGYYYSLESNSTSAQKARSSSLQTFNSNGFDIDLDYEINQNGLDYASWTFRKAEKFFDVVTWTGDGTGARTLSHNLGSVPACMIVKRYNGDPQSWEVYHESLGNTKGLHLDLTNAASTWSVYWDNTSPTENSFTVGENKNSNNPAGTAYVAYLFASDAGGFGDDGDENIIKCGSFTTDSNAKFFANTGFEPQWVLVKRSDGASAWNLLDTMRGLLSEGTAGGKYLRPNTSGAEGNLSSTDSEYINATGFGGNGNGVTGSANATFIYVAIRRPMKTPESGTEVYATAQRDTTAPIFEGGFPVDAAIIADVSGAWSNSPSMGSRLTGTSRLATSNTNAEGSDGLFKWDYMNGWGDGSGSYPEYYSWMFKRATGFMDVVAWSGTNLGTRVLNHNLGVQPELIIAKKRNSSDIWAVQTIDSVEDQILKLNTSDAYAATSSYLSYPTQNTSTTFKARFNLNQTGNTYIAYLFATLDGVSKVGSYTGTGANLNVDCGFSAGARFILIKRTDGSGDWYVWDSKRGIVAGNDPYLLLNSSAAQVTNTDYIDPLSSGFTVTSSAPAALNASGGNYIFLAIA